MWTEITRPQYDRSSLRYASGLTNEEWKVIAPHLLRQRQSPVAANCCRKKDVCGNPICSGCLH